MNGDATLITAAGGPDPETGLIRAAPRYPDLAKITEEDLPRLVYRIPVDQPNGAIFQVSGSIHYYAETVAQMRAIDVEVNRLFGGVEVGSGAEGVWWLDSGYRYWSVVVGGGEDPQTRDDEPLHWWREIDVNGSVQ